MLRVERLLDGVSSNCSKKGKKDEKVITSVTMQCLVSAQTPTLYEANCVISSDVYFLTSSLPASSIMLHDPQNCP